MKLLLMVEFAVLVVAFVRAESYDLVIYGSSPAAISAAVQEKCMSKRAVADSTESGKEYRGKMFVDATLRFLTKNL